MTPYSLKDKRKDISDLIQGLPTTKRPQARKLLTACKDIQGLVQGLRLCGVSDEDLRRVFADDTAKSPSEAREGALTSSAGFSLSEGEQGQGKPVGVLQNVDRLQGDIVGSDSGLDMDYVKQGVEQCISDYLSMVCVESVSKLTNRQWCGLAYHVGDSFIDKERLLYIYDPAIYQERISPYRLADLVRYYMTLCDDTSHVCLPEYVAKFCGVSDDILYDYMDFLRVSGIDLRKNREISLASGIIDSKTNVTGAIACLNHWHQWTSPSQSQHIENKTTVIYPTLVNINPNETKQALPEKPAMP